MLDFNIMDGAGEQGMNLGLLFFVISAITLPLAQYEQLVAIQNKAEVERNKTDLRATNEVALLEISCAASVENGCDKAVYFWKDEKGNNKRKSYEADEVHAWIQSKRPTTLQIRMDRRLPNGELQDIVLLASPLNIGLELRTQ